MKQTDKQKLEELRAHIDATDRGIVALMQRRASLVASIHQIKRSSNLAALDEDREEIVWQKVLAAHAEQPAPKFGEFTLGEVFSALLRGFEDLEQ